jgi:hypothetical protein|tara:strand:- start:696 stop:884 length:189 start_codon:yes stop_codon:yes gene_type:complete
MYIKHLIAEILDLQKVIPVSTEEKFTKDELEYMPEGRLKELKFQYQLINGSLSDSDIMTSLN